MDQKYYPKYKDKKFSGMMSEKKFEDWLKQKAVKKISFKDNGQDCLEWMIDEGGEVLHSNLQAFVWNGSIVDLSRLKVNNNIGLMNPAKLQTDYLDFIVEKIIDLKG